MLDKCTDPWKDTHLEERPFADAFRNRYSWKFINTVFTEKHLCWLLCWQHSCFPVKIFIEHPWWLLLHLLNYVREGRCSHKGFFDSMFLIFTRNIVTVHYSHVNKFLSLSNGLCVGAYLQKSMTFIFLHIDFQSIEAVSRMCSVKKVFLKIDLQLY